MLTVDGGLFYFRSMHMLCWCLFQCSRTKFGRGGLLGSCRWMEREGRTPVAQRACLATWICFALQCSASLRAWLPTDSTWSQRDTTWLDLQRERFFLLLFVGSKRKMMLPDMAPLYAFGDDWTGHDNVEVQTVIHFLPALIPPNFIIHHPG